MKIKHKITLLIIISVITVTAVSTAWYLFPKTFLVRIEPSDIKSISVFDGNTGEAFVIDDLTEITYIVENIQGTKMRRDKLSVGYSGFRFVMSFKDSDGKEIDSFVINGTDTIRDDPFFYRCNGGLCFDYIEGLKDKYAK